jgi:hypothetical protein
MQRTLLFVALLAVASLGQAANWIYQGTLNDGGKPANGLYDLRLRLLDASGERALVEPVILYAVPVTKGSFAVDVEFGIDLRQAGAVLLATEVRQGDSDFVSLGAPSKFDPNVPLAVCWETTGNSGITGLTTVGTNAPTDTDLMSLRSRGNSILYVRGSTRGVEQNNSSALGLGAAAWNDSSAVGPNSFTSGAGITTAAASNSFVHADGTLGPFMSSSPNQFLVRADGGMALNTTEIGPTDDFIVSARLGADADADIVWKTHGGGLGSLYLVDSDRRFVLSAAPTGATYLGTSANGALLTTGGIWTNGSSREFKQEFAAIDVMDVLGKVIRLPISTWTYKNSTEGQHLGPMAEDFHAAFGVGTDAQHIATVDADGVALAAIQGLNQKLEAENAALRARLDALEARQERPE